jgi:hypothetical protein
MAKETDHEAPLLAAKAAVEAQRPRWDAVLAARRQAALDAKSAGVTIYRIAKILGVEQSTARQILGIPRKPPSPQTGERP